MSWRRHCCTLTIGENENTRHVGKGRDIQLDENERERERKREREIESMRERVKAKWCTKVQSSKEEKMIVRMLFTCFSMEMRKKYGGP